MISEISRRTAQNMMPCILFDEWTSRSSDQFISVVAKYSDLTLNLGLVLVKQSANAENLYSAIKDHLKDFGLEFPKFITCDGAKVNHKLAKIGGLNIQTCQNHGIHLAVTDTIYKAINVDPDSANDGTYSGDDDEEGPALCDDLKTVISNVRTLMIKFKNSPKLLKELKKYGPDHKMPVIDVKTRWNSLLYMLK